ncbi:MAG: TonB family protein [Bacteroidia bacterium]|jgi:protein TonB|nr:TonB family protein [Bacteroidia bacterium]
MDNKFVLSDSFNEVIFEHRNKAYGAYQMRRRYGRQMVSAALIACVLFAGLFVYAHTAMAYHTPAVPKPYITTHVTEVKLLPDLRPSDPVKPRQEPKPEQPKPSVRFAPKASAQITSQIDVTHKPVDKIPDNTAGGSPKGTDGGLGGGTSGSECDDCPPALLPEPGPAAPAKIPDWVEIMPENNGLIPYLRNNVRYPLDARELGIEGTVILEFIVNKDGSFRDIKVIRGVCPSIDREAIRVAQKMPRWKPGFQNGNAVDVICRQPIVFKLTK